MLPTRCVCKPSTKVRIIRETYDEGIELGEMTKREPVQCQSKFHQVLQFIYVYTNENTVNTLIR